MKGSGSPMGRNTPRILAVLLWLASVLVPLSPTGVAAAAAPLASFLGGAVRAADGSPVAGAVVEVYADPGTTRVEYLGQARTAGDGSWQLPAPPGTYTVFAADRTGERAVERRSRVVHDTPRTELDLTLGDAADPGAVVGAVVDGSGDGVAGAQATLYHLYDRGPGAWDYVVEGGSTTTDRAGGYRLAVPRDAGHVSVAVTGDGRRAGLAGGDVAADPGLVPQQPVTDAGTLVLRTDLQLVAAGVAAVSGEAAVGATLTALAPRFDPAPDRLAVRWLRDGRRVAVGRQYVPVAADLGRGLSIEVTATAGGDQVVSASRSVVVRRASSVVQAPGSVEVTAGSPSALRVRVVSTAGRRGRIEVSEGGRTVGEVAHRGATPTRVPLRPLARGRHVLRVGYTGDALTRGSSASVVVRAVAPRRLPRSRSWRLEGSVLDVRGT